MPVEIRIEGAERLDVLARRLKETGDRDLRKELFRGLNRAAKPLKPAAQRAAEQRLPRRGRLNEWVASAKFSVSTRTGRDPAVRLTGLKAGHDLAALNRGRLRHPLFGNRRHWYTQQITPRVITDGIEAEAPKVRQEIIAVLDDIAVKLGR